MRIRFGQGVATIMTLIVAVNENYYR